MVLLYFEIIYNQGISREGEIISLGVVHDLVNKSGAWYDYKGKPMGQGKENAREFLRANKEIAEEIKVENPAKKVVAVSRIKSLSEKYILTDYVDGRWIYWEYKEGFEVLKKRLIK